MLRGWKYFLYLWLLIERAVWRGWKPTQKMNAFYPIRISRIFNTSTSVLADNWRYLRCFFSEVNNLWLCLCIFFSHNISDNSAISVYVVGWRKCVLPYLRQRCFFKFFIRHLTWIIFLVYFSSSIMQHLMSSLFSLGKKRILFVYFESLFVP